MKSFNIQNVNAEEINNVLLELKKTTTKQKSQNSASLISLNSFVSVLQGCANTLQSLDNNLQFYIDYFEGVLDSQDSSSEDSSDEEDDTD